MKKLIIIIMFLSASAYAQTYSINPSLDSLRLNAFGQLSIPATGTGRVTTSAANFIINKSIGDVCDAYPALEKIDTLSVDRSASGYTLNSDFLRVRHVFRVDYYNDQQSQQLWFPLNYINFDSLASVYATKKENVDEIKKIFGERTTYYTFGRQLFLHPKNYSLTTDPDTLIVFYYARDRMLTTGTDSTRISPEYMDELMSYIMAGLKALQEDYDVSGFYYNNNNSAIPVTREGQLKR